jgi:hypothetical protein
VGLIARAVEATGIPTVSISITKELTKMVGVPRALYLRWPLGHPLGAAGQSLQQRTVIFDSLRLLQSAQRPGIIEEPGYRWRRESYSEPDWSQLAMLTIGK